MLLIRMWSIPWEPKRGCPHDRCHIHERHAISQANDASQPNNISTTTSARQHHHREEELSLATDELAFYDAIVQNDAAVLEFGDETLKKIAHELVGAVRSSATIDWNLKESVRADMRAKIKRLLTRYDYPPDKEEKAIELVLQQAELFAADEAA
jgi:hypothetical protein